MLGCRGGGGLCPGISDGPGKFGEVFMPLV